MFQKGFRAGIPESPFRNSGLAGTVGDLREPLVIWALFGTTEVVPFHETLLYCLVSYSVRKPGILRVAAKL